MLGFSAVGQYALGQISVNASANLTGVAGTGAVGTMVGLPSAEGMLVGVFGAGFGGSPTPISTAIAITPSGVYGTGVLGTLVASIASPTLAGVYCTGAVGTITLYIPLPITRRLTLSNVLRRLRLLGNWTAPRARNMYVGRDFDPANSTEDEVYSLDFVNELASGESLLSITSIDLTVFQGTDADPSSHLSGTPSISGTVVSQRLTSLTSGVTYTLAMTVLTNQTNTLTLFSRVACRPVQ